MEKLQQVREELMHTEAECEEKRSQLQQTGSGDEVLKGDEVYCICQYQLCCGQEGGKAQPQLPC